MSQETLQILQKLDQGEISAEKAQQMLEGLAEAGRAQLHESWLDRLLPLFGAGAKFTEELDWSLDAQEVSLIQARTSNGSISMHGTEGDQVTVGAWKTIRAPTAKAAEAFACQVEIHVERHDDEIRIYKEHPRPPLGTNVSVRYEISSPRGVNARLHTSNGAVRIDEINGAVEANTSNGALELRGGRGQVDLRTSNGAIQVWDAAGRVRAGTSNGKIQASLGRLEEGVFSTSNGSINIEIREGNAPVTAKTSNGAVRLTLPTGFDGQLDAQATHGRVHSEIPVSALEGSRTRLVGQIGEGGEALVRLRTLNGSIHLQT